MRTLRTVILVSLLSLTFSTKGQTDAQLTQYFLMPAYYNPGASGDTDYVRIAGDMRLQWIGIPNAPRTFILSADGPMKLKDQRIGLGLNIQYETIGLFANTIVGLQGAWGIPMGPGRLNVGLTVAYAGQRFRGAEAILPEEGGDGDMEPAPIPARDMSASAIDLNVGLYYCTSKFYAGLSGLHLFEPRLRLTTGFDNETAAYESLIPRQLYFTTGGNIPISNTLFSIHPSMLVRTDFSSWTADLTIRAGYAGMIFLGAGYRWKDAVSVMISAEIKNFFVGYAYDIAVSAIGRASSGSHEILAGYKIKLDFSKKNKFKQRSVRFM